MECGGQATSPSRWRAAIYLGLLSSTFSTIISQLAAGRIGRDAAVDWMSVAAIPARDWALSAEPSLIAIAIGIAFHQTADFSWALVFFGVFGRWTDRLQPRTLAVLAFPWALLTSGLEWFVLVPLIPFCSRSLRCNNLIGSAYWSTCHPPACIPPMLGSGAHTTRSVQVANAFCADGALLHWWRSSPSAYGICSLPFSATFHGSGGTQRGTSASCGTWQLITSKE
jgi:hypothetical protein